MNTPAHILIAAAMLARPGGGANAQRRNWAVAAGAIAPDATIFVFFIWAQFFTPMGWGEMWGDAYWREPWQILGAISNSVPLAFFLLGLAVWRKIGLLKLFALSLLVHAALDFPLHADDAHRHFWPITDWRFISPISYWDPAQNGMIGALIEGSAIATAAIAIRRRFSAGWVRYLSSRYVFVYITLNIWFFTFGDRYQI